MRHPETGPDHSGNENETKIDIGRGEMTDEEYKAESLRSHQEVRMALERDLMEWQERYEKRQEEGMTDEQRKQYEEKIGHLKKQIALAAKEKAEVVAAFEESKRKRGA